MTRVQSQIGKARTIIKLGEKILKLLPNGNWVEVSEYGMTKKEHEDKAREHGKKMSESQLIEAKVESKDEKYHFNEEQKHLKEASKLSDKELTSMEIIIENLKSKLGSSYKIFHLSWDSSFYGKSAPDTLKGIEFFTEDLGYIQEDIESIKSLTVGSTKVLDEGRHVITRIQ